MTETTPQDVRADQQEDSAGYSSLSSPNHNGLTSILLFDLNTSPFALPDETQTIDFNLNIAADGDHDQA